MPFASRPHLLLTLLALAACPPPIENTETSDPTTEDGSTTEPDDPTTSLPPVTTDPPPTTETTDTEVTETTVDPSTTTEPDTTGTDTEPATDTDTETDSTTEPAPFCGDGSVDEGEQCDDGNADPGDGCSSACEDEPRVAFVTSDLFCGNILPYDAGCAEAPLHDACAALLGVELADCTCTALAGEAGLPGTFRAWLSGANDDTAPTGRFAKSFKGQYVLTGEDAPLLATGWAELASKGPAVPIDRDELGAPVEGTPWVWTNTRPNGQSASDIANCTEWTASEVDGSIVIDGNSKIAASAGWTLNGPQSGDCNDGRRLYCFQDLPTE